MVLEDEEVERVVEGAEAVEGTAVDNLPLALIVDDADEDTKVEEEEVDEDEETVVGVFLLTGREDVAARVTPLIPAAVAVAAEVVETEVKDADAVVDDGMVDRVGAAASAAGGLVDSSGTPVLKEPPTFGIDLDVEPSF